MLRPGFTRFLLAFSVILYHLNRSIFLGFFAVGCFFILSGYWIALMYEKKYSKKKQPLKVFYVSRLWRLLPVFYAFTILGLIVKYLSHSKFFENFSSLGIYQKAGVLISNIILLGYSSVRLKNLVPAWSLDIEMQFYIIFPLLVYLVRNNKKLLIVITALFFAIALYILAFYPAMFINSSLSYFYLFFLGVAIYHFKLNPGAKIEKLSLILFFSIILIQYLNPSLAPYYRDGTSKYYIALSFVLILTAIPSLISSVYQKTNDRDKFLGEMSFLIYLSHWVWIIPYEMFVEHGSKMARIPYVFGFLFVTFLSSYLVYKFVDRPFEKLRQKWVNAQE